MAIATTTLHDALIRTAARLREGATYQWTHMGACNCGHLAQTVTNISRADLHAMALERAGDWSEQVVEYCPTSGLPIDHVISTMLAIGLTTNDLAHLERLNAPEVLALLPEGERHLDYRERGDVVRYMETWAALLARELPQAHEPVHGGRRADERREHVPDRAPVTPSAPELSRAGSDQVGNVTQLRDGEPRTNRELGDGNGVRSAKTGKAA